MVVLDADFEISFGIWARTSGICRWGPIRYEHMFDHEDWEVQTTDQLKQRLIANQANKSALDA